MKQDPYRRTASMYDRLFEPMNRGLRLLSLRMFHPDQSMKVLDVGCGTGTHLEIYRRSGCELYGIDLSQSMLNIARNRLGEEVDLRLGDALKLPYKNGAFDLILCMLTLHEMDQDTRLSVIAEMKRVLKPDGHILLIDFHAGPARSLKSWLKKLIIFLSEVAAGRRHFRNYRHFISIGGLPTLIEESRLMINREKVVGGETMALYLLREK
jgi:ubiquinone/menaquinone biosynthesis C-methylase UbiE